MSGVSASAAVETDTIRSALRMAKASLRRSDTADLDAEILLAQLLDVDRAFLHAHGEYALDVAQTRAFQSMLERRAAGEPIAYIIGEKGFYDLDLLVTPAVLIPRPETELLLEEALRLTTSIPAASIADIGTGSGALAIALARQRPRCRVYATDISADALAIARQNATDHDAAVAFFGGNLAGPLIDRGIKVDLLLANLPYIASADLKTLEVGRWEPRLALDGGADGLSLIRELLCQLPSVCKPGAHVLLEIGASQGAALRQLLRDRLRADADVLPDYAGFDRIVRFAVN